ncbi:hypothetical protein GFS31_13180 [Leptolyngbya sp. BL0902]|uniref:hypothetical protein n=1 Tax=Leptolyngbya sp. BL0902 TaxID=1115757 RepID=UPI0019390D47|nr:hypothetical protein [Leptolyngbya sp. BL0902]QQE64637.1 hypothetical protein GFS31_13180 [Leptolyngbya sp. BL0902]
MSAVEKNSWPESEDNASQSSDSEATKPKAERPALVAPPPRPIPSPAKPAAAKPAAAKGAAKPAAVEPPPAPPEPVFDPAVYRNQPIAPPSEPMQYRAIGLVRGTYAPTDADQINRGNLTTDDGLVVDSVLLGRVTSLVKKHLDLTTSHLWVVYPRTRREVETEAEQDLHFQIVGVWEPETLGLPGESPRTEEVAADDEAAPPTVPAAVDAYPAVDDNFFSIRGEVVKYDPEEDLITVKIVQGIKQTPGGAKSFKLTLKGHIEGRTVGYFWDFQAKRDDRVLAIESASVVGIVPPKKRPKGGSKRPGFKRPGGPRSAAAPRKTTGAPRPKKVIADKGMTNPAMAEPEAAE